MNAAKLLMLYDKVSETPDSVARLRRFVLDLAVRGKLVEQDSADEPASELLKRVAAARKNAPKSGRNGKKKLVDPSLTELPFALPTGWSRARLSELVRVVNGRAYKKPELLDEGTPVVRVGNLFTSDHWYYSNLELEDDKYCDKGDLIYAWSASFGPFIWDGPRVIYHYHIWKLPLFSEADLDKHFLYLFLLQKTREIKDAGHGISMVHMTKEKMEQLAVPLPPLAEQQRIVAKVDELMALLDRLEAAHTAREATRNRLTAASLARLTTPDTDADTFRAHARFATDNLPAFTEHSDQIKSLRQTILDLAVRGKLVEQDPADEPASDLLKRIAAEKARLVKAGEIRGKAAQERKMVDPPFDLPATWRWVSLGTAFLYDAGVKCEPKVLDPSLWLLELEDIEKDTGRLLTRLRASDRESKSTKSRFERGDVLYGKLRPYLTKVLVADKPGYSTTEIVAIRSFIPLCPEYCSLALRRPDFVEYVTRHGQGTKMPRLRTEDAIVAPFPLPPLAEQQRIVAKVDELMALLDRLETSLAAADNTRQHLLESLLHEALVPATARETEVAV